MTTTQTLTPPGFVLSDIDLEVGEPWDITAHGDTITLHLHTASGTTLAIHVHAELLDRMEDALAEAQHVAEAERRGMQP